MKKLLVTLTLITGSLFFFASCTKTGPMGPQGPQGPQGVQGNANVIGSDPFDVSSWSLNTSENAYVASFSAPTITTAVAARGVVQVYLYYSSDQTWRNLPDIYAGTQFYYRFSTGGFEIYYGKVDGSTPAFPTGTWTFRLVVISPSQKAAHPNTNWNNYKETMKVLEEEKAVSSQTITGNVTVGQ